MGFSSAKVDSPLAAALRWPLLVLLLPGWFGLVRLAALRLAEEPLDPAVLLPVGLAAVGFCLHRLLVSGTPGKAGRFAAFLSTFEHEATHALAGLLFLRPPSELHVTERNGGYMKLATGNWFISLAPYAIPLYALALAGLGFALREELRGFAAGAAAVLYGGWLSELLRSIHPKQTDLVQRGYVQSIAWIVLFQTALAAVALAVASGRWAWGEAAGSAAGAYAACLGLLRAALGALGGAS